MVGTTCSPCLDNTYSKQGGKCTAGPPNCLEAVHASTTAKCQTCMNGYGLQSDGTCDKCTGNTYSDGSTDCKDGTANCKTSSGTSSACKLCNAGYGLEDGLCKECTGATGSDGSKPCQTVPNCVEAVHNALAKCKTCITGHGPDSSTKKCVQCTGNMYSDGTTACKEGFANCNKTSNYLWYAQCEKCNPGYGIVKDTATQKDACEECVGNTFSDGTTACVTGLANCAEAVHTLSYAECQRCDAGYGLSDTKSCDKCEGNTFSNGTVACESQENCTVVNAATGACTHCKAGFGLEGGSCVACTGNTYAAHNTSGGCVAGPSNCEEAVHTEGGKCAKCDADNTVSYGLLEGGTCQKCEGDTSSDGTYPCSSIRYCLAISGETCTRCKGGYRLKADDLNQCVQCNVTDYNDGTWAECRPGPDNCAKAQQDASSAMCAECSDTYGLLEDGTCTQCTGNTFSNGRFACREGPANCKEAVHDTDYPTCGQCKPGYGLDGNPAGCVKCEGNTYSDGTEPCAKVENCTEAVNDAGEPLCKRCEAGFAVVPEDDDAYDSSSSLDDDDGGDDSQKHGVCVQCIGNTFSDGTMECTEGVENCELADNDNNTAVCEMCLPGFGLSEDGLSCRQCAVNETSDGRTPCRVIPNCVKAETNNRMPNCLLCSPGYGFASGLCSACAVGKFSDGNGTCQECECYAQKLCSDCDSVNGTSTAVLCGQGQYINPHNTSMCIDCQTGFFKSDTEMSAADCKQCPCIKSAECIECDHITGEGTLAWCKRGFERSTKDVSKCDACPKGQFSAGGDNVCVDKCPLFTADRGTCTASVASMGCKWSDLHKLCYADPLNPDYLVFETALDEAAIKEKMESVLGRNVTVILADAINKKWVVILEETGEDGLLVDTLAPQCQMYFNADPTKSGYVPQTTVVVPSSGKQNAASFLVALIALIIAALLSF